MLWCILHVIRVMKLYNAMMITRCFYSTAHLFSSELICTSLISEHQVSNLYEPFEIERIHLDIFSSLSDVPIERFWEGVEKKEGREKARKHFGGNTEVDTHNQRVYIYTQNLNKYAIFFFFCFVF